MASSTLTLPVDTISAPHSLFSKPHPAIDERSTSPIHRHPTDQQVIEMNTLGPISQPVSTVTSIGAEVPAWTMSTKDEWTAIGACCVSLFLMGWNDAATGPLLPTIQAHYKVNFTVVSMLFVSACSGFMSASLINIHLTDRLGFGKVMLLGGILQVVAYSLLAAALPFPAMCITYAINGFGIALQMAQANGFVAALPNNTSAKMGLLHAVYGAGAFVVPLVATQFSQMSRWSFHYLTSLGLALTNSVVLLVVFRLRTQQEILGTSTHHEPEGQISPSQQNKYKEIFGSRAVQLMAFFSWVYVGVEVTVGGWVVTFVIEERGGGPSAGYISSGFFGGLMLGRVVLLWINAKIGERRVVYLYCLLSIGLELVVWLVPNIIGNAVAVSFVGMFLGTIVPKRILTGSIGWISSFGQAGSAVFPFMTGALAQKYGVKVLQPMLVGMLAALIVLWSLIPSGQKRRGD